MYFCTALFTAVSSTVAIPRRSCAVLMTRVASSSICGRSQRPSNQVGAPETSGWSACLFFLIYVFAEERTDVLLP